MKYISSKKVLIFKIKFFTFFKYFNLKFIYNFKGENFVKEIIAFQRKRKDNTLEKNYAIICYSLRENEKTPKMPKTLRHLRQRKTSERLNVLGVFFKNIKNFYF